jgi:hypothetical protein
MSLYAHRFGPVEQPGFRAVITRTHQRSLAVARAVAAVTFCALMLLLLAARH